ncbi:TraR/DksA C4-type zinc finger protein [Methanothermococcus sp. SCGC AD-155-C09]|nr:TraR/DksA C4-type zinc finger protein [Methanothermococcus sp. SCGC AD-155-C09]
MDEDLKKIIDFHGHFCPGIAMGYRVAKYVMKNYKKSSDEELVAIVYNDSCSVDAIQCLLSCTFGKGNLIFKDYGKHVYIFYHRENKKGIRISFKEEISEKIGDIRNKILNAKGENRNMEHINKLKKEYSDEILRLSEEELFDIMDIDIPEPKRAKIYPSIKCEECGEYFMEIRGRIINGKIVCMECFGKLIDED